MRLFPSDEIPPRGEELFCRQSRLTVLVGVLLFGALLLGVPAFIWWDSDLPWWGNWILIGLWLMILEWLIRWLVNSFRRGNWVARFRPEGVWLNIRAYENQDFDRAPTVLLIGYDEIASAAETVIQRTEQFSDSTSTWKDRYLDLHLADSAPEEIVTAVSEERHRMKTSRFFFGLVPVRSRVNHVPVLMPSAVVVRIHWRGQQSCVVPKLSRALDALRPHVEIGESTAKVMGDWALLTDEEVDGLVIDLVQSGSDMQAIKLLEQKRGMTLTEAHTFVKELDETLK